MILNDRIILEYVDFNDAQNQLNMSEKVHFIFALDESGSMNGSRWD